MLTIVGLTLLGGLALGGCMVAGFSGSRGARSPARWAATALVGVGVVGALHSTAFDGYDTDFWSYAIVVERVANGDAVWSRDPFRLEAPANPQVSPYWMLLGRVKKTTGIGTGALIRLVGLAVAAGLWAGVTRLARLVLPDRDVGWVAVPLFWLSIPDQWWSLGLGRSVSLVFAWFAVGSVLKLKDEASASSAWKKGADATTVAILLALAFHAHVFGGVVALGGAAVAAVARWRRGDPCPGFTLALVLVLTVLLAWPSLGRVLETAALPRNPAHLGPHGGQQLLWGLRWMTPAALLGLLPGPMFLLVAIGLGWVPGPSEALARTLAGVGTLFNLVLFLTPAYHLAVTVFGGWLVVRFAVLAFAWVASALALARLLRGPRWARALAGSLVLWLTAGVSLQLAGAFLDRNVDLRIPASSWSRHYLYASSEAQAEARRLRGILKGRVYVSADVLAYGTAATTLGRPLAIPPGHASPFDDVRRKRRADRALTLGTRGCWAALFRMYPDLEFLLTPAPGADVENDAWQRRLEVRPEEVRRGLLALGALEPAFRGRYLVVDRIRNPSEARPGLPIPTGEGLSTCS